LHAWRRVALADRFDLSVAAHQDVADERLRLPWLHGQVRTVDDEQFIYGEEAVRTQQNRQESCTKEAPATGKDHFLGSSIFIPAQSFPRERIHQGLCDLFAGKGYSVPLLPRISWNQRSSCSAVQIGRLKKVNLNKPGPAVKKVGDDIELAVKSLLPPNAQADVCPPVDWKALPGPHNLNLCFEGFPR
jgi:hypothetical protein